VTFDRLDPGWKLAILAHYGAIAVSEYLVGLAGTPDETRHSQIQTYLP
jgi:toluene monooxygenase system protein A